MRSRANNLRRIRKESQLPMLGLSVKSGVSTTIISGIERFGYFPGLDIRQRLTEALGVSIGSVWPELDEVTTPDNGEGSDGTTR